jgi:hypothetical protein
MPNLFLNRHSEIIFGISEGHVLSIVELLYFILECINLKCLALFIAIDYAI